VQQLLSCAGSLFVAFGNDVLGRMQDWAPFIFEETDLFDSEPAPAEDLGKSVEELKASNKLWHELHTEILPAAAGTAAASPPPDMKKYLMYAELAQEVARTTLSDAPAPSLQSLRSRLVDLLEPEAWASIEASVTGPTLETPPPICDILDFRNKGLSLGWVPKLSEPVGEGNAAALLKYTFCVRPGATEHRSP
jgi:hypothetical protein